MNRTTGKIVTALFAMLLAMPTLAAPKGWTVDFEAAKKQAAKEGKDLLLEFTGSDWCPPCKKLKADIFDKEHFQTEAPKDFVLVKLDFPRDKSNQTPEEIEQNKKLAKKYEVSGYPTVILADVKGNPYSTAVGFGGDSVEDYVKNLREKKQLRVKRDKFLKIAQGAEGLAKAEALDKAIGGFGADIIMTQYKKEMETIMKIDADNGAGLKQKYQNMKDKVEIEADVNKIMRSSRGDSAGAIKKIDELIEKRKPKGEALQQVYFAKASILFQLQKKDEAQALLEKAHGVAPKSELGKQIKRIVKQFFPDSKLNDKKG